MMTLSGCRPGDLLKAITDDAKKHDVRVEVSEKPFSRDAWKREIDAGRPVLVSCHVRLPHKAQLVWDHQVTGIGWSVIDGEFFVIVHDNFYPTKRANAARWLRADALESIITITPQQVPARGG